MSARNGRRPFAWFGEEGSGAFITKGSRWEETTKPVKDIGIMAFLFILLLAFSKRNS